jgi:hypothetical protein
MGACRAALGAALQGYALALFPLLVWVHNDVVARRRST